MNLDLVIRAGLMFAAFCMASSFAYIINDIADLKSDAVHPMKKTRPIASSRTSVLFASVTAFSFWWGGDSMVWRP
jgi:decaprenyl-phosphate phosphoribosyltransferase